MFSQSHLLHPVFVAFLGVLLLLGALVTIAFLAGVSAEDLRAGFRSKAVTPRRPTDAREVTVRYVLGLGLLVSGPLLVAAALLFVSVWRPTRWYWWLVGAVALGVGLIWLSDRVGPATMTKETDRERVPFPPLSLRLAAGLLLGLGVLVAAVLNVAVLLFTGEPLYRPHPLNPLFPLAVIVLSTAASRLINGAK